MIGSVALLPELLKDSRASNTVKSYIHGLSRWKLCALSNGLGGKDILPARAFHAYAGFFRSNELLNIKRCDIVIENTHSSIFIESSKTDKYRNGALVVISRTGTSLCPIKNLERYLLWADIEEMSDVHIFGTISACKTGYKIRKCSKVISYTTLRELFIEAFRPHVPDIS
ncbi:MAG: hypothetical protein AB2693_28320, partial [Candidatus Thiodiazotropha sp.]